MSAVEALKTARDAGIHVGIDGDDLVLEASAPPPLAVLDLLSRYKRAILGLLRRTEDGWTAEDWQVFFDERAGIAEFDGGLPRPQAKARAFACCAAEWLTRNPVRSPLFPEAFVSVYLRGLGFGAVVGSRSAAGREQFRLYWESAIAVPGPEVEQLAKSARMNQTHLVIGVMERNGALSTAPCSSSGQTGVTSASTASSCQPPASA